MKKANQDIRDTLELERIFFWEVAAKLNTSAPNFTIMMRTELNEEKRKKVIKAIKDIKADRAKSIL